MSGSGLSLKLLGTAVLHTAEGPVELSPSATMLCAYLALGPREGRSRAAAAAQLFANCPDRAARRRLNTALWRLRTAIKSRLGVDLVAVGGNSRLTLSAAVPLVVDATVFEALVSPILCLRAAELTEPQAAELERAVLLHRGQLLERCDDDWVLTDRYRIENLYFSALDYLVQYHGARGEIGAVAKFGDLALTVEPLREDVHRHLMNAYGRSGRTDLVERQFERCRTLLLDELGADPMPETLAAYARLMRPGGAGTQLSTVAELLAELERARRDLRRLSDTVDRALDRLRQMS